MRRNSEEKKKNSQTILPKINPAIVAYNTTSPTYTAVFLLPRTPLTTSILGRLKLGPARSKASAGPECIPLAINACSIGISVKVEKYMKAPNIDATTFPKTVFCPTMLVMVASGSSGMINPEKIHINYQGNDIKISPDVKYTLPC